MSNMKDALGRTIDYMRISITDRCNLRCKYCMPYGVECVPDGISCLWRRSRPWESVLPAWAYAISR